MLRVVRAVKGVLAGVALAVTAGVFSASSLAQADVKAQAKRAGTAVKRGAHDTAKAAAPVGTAVARGTKKGVSAVKRAGSAVGNAVRGK